MLSALGSLGATRGEGENGGLPATDPSSSNDDGAGSPLVRDPGDGHVGLLRVESGYLPDKSNLARFDAVCQPGSQTPDHHLSKIAAWLVGFPADAVARTQLMRLRAALTSQRRT
jgi:hypothetical protein